MFPRNICVISLEHGFRAVLVDEVKMMVLQVFLLKSSLQWSLTGPCLFCVVISVLFKCHRKISVIGRELKICCKSEVVFFQLHERSELEAETKSNPLEVLNK